VRRQSRTGIPAISGLLHVAIWPGGQGDGAAGASTAAAGVTGGATAGAGAGDGAGVATAVSGISGGSGSGGATADARAGAEVGADVPVMLGASAIGPGVGSTAAAGGLASAAAWGGGGSFGTHALSQSGTATSVAAGHANQIRRIAGPGCFRGAIALSSELGIGVFPGIVSPRDYALPTRERHASNNRMEQCRDRAAQFGRAVGFAQHLVA